ncbi:hypothetical protein [Noviherbaspirillum suwonense]|uniref:Lipoprotein n=1 Tax=Noviherbaspirillum suwonense TaxID=1224511 RepID=A0ABY1PUF6_9BURK|nr:hypothetical protein [Noviherbaspirillum suwonense]SMP45761.1 hypothetical protein SAMN06295970_101561 [Noviherbaspirillum suwonense]
MIKRIPGIAALAAVVFLSTGCAVNRATATLTPGADLGKVRTIYIEKEKGDDRAIDLILKTNLEKRGYTVTTGDAPKSDKPVDAALSYVDRWMWDITMYMLELTVTLRDPVTSFPMAVGNSYHTSLTRKSPDEMVDEVLGNMLSPAKAAAAQAPAAAAASAAPAR